MGQNVIDILHDCKLFAGVSAPGFQRLVSIARLCRFAKGELIFRERDEPAGVYVVGSGQVRVFKTAPGGKEHVLHVVGHGGTFAEVAAIGRFDLPASAEAVEPTVCVLLPSDRFRKLLDEDHDLCCGILSGMARWVRHLVGLMEDIVLRDAAGRLARYLLDAPASSDGTVELPTLKRHLASHLNLTSETFSRTLRRLVEAGMIAEVDSHRVRLIQPERLRQVTEGAFPEL